METRILGRTGLNASVMGFGCGGPSRVGQSQDKSHDDSVRVVRAALDAGVNFIDTAEGYRTELIVGEAITGRPREDVIISTKKSLRGKDGPPRPVDVVEGLEASLKRLGTEYIDVYHLHGLQPDAYVQTRDELMPALLDLRDQGKVRFTGVTEMFSKDMTHEMLQMAMADDCWDVVMVGFNLLNQTARGSVLEPAIAKDIGTLIMFAVRRALSQPEMLREVIGDLIDRGKIDGAGIDHDNPLGFLLDQDDVVSVTDAAYRYSLYEPGAHVNLSGTGNLEHLKENIASHERGDLLPEMRARLDTIFAAVDDVTG